MQKQHLYISSVLDAHTCTWRHAENDKSQHFTKSTMAAKFKMAVRDGGHFEIT